jgi:hypothetical protein
MAESKFGVSVHWTTQSMPVKGEIYPFTEAVEKFDVKRFDAQIEASGADYLIFTPNHAEYYFPGPVEAVRRIMPSRAMRRDLVGEIAAAMKKRGKHFMLYYNLKADDEWETAMGYYHPESFEPFIQNLCAVVGGISEHYSGLLDGWWFDCGYAVDNTRPADKKLLKAPSLAGQTYKFPWERLTAAAKKGGENILVSYSPGANINDYFIYTEHQDYFHGERGYFPPEELRKDYVPLKEICHLPTDRHCPNGLQWHQWTCLDNRAWVHLLKDSPAKAPLYTEDEVFEFVKICAEKKAAITFNIEIFRDGDVSEKAVKFLSNVSKRLSQRRE